MLPVCLNESASVAVWAAVAAAARNARRCTMPRMCDASQTRMYSDVIDVDMRCRLPLAVSPYSRSCTREFILRRNFGTFLCFRTPVWFVGSLKTTTLDRSDLCRFQKEQIINILIKKITVMFIKCFRFPRDVANKNPIKID